jgi:hypothetical protein
MERGGRHCQVALRLCEGREVEVRTPHLELRRERGEGLSGAPYKLTQVTSVKSLGRSGMHTPARCSS